MKLDEPFREARARFSHLTFYERFEHAVVLLLTALIVVVVASATWHLALAVFALVPADQVDPANQQVFQAVFGMILTVIIALEFEHSPLVVLEGRGSVVRVRSVVLIAPPAVACKSIIVDVEETGPAALFAPAAAISAPGVVDWLVRDHEDGPGVERGAVSGGAAD